MLDARMISFSAAISTWTLDARLISFNAAISAWVISFSAATSRICHAALAMHHQYSLMLVARRIFQFTRPGSTGSSQWMRPARHHQYPLMEIQLQAVSFCHSHHQYSLEAN
eukprot:8471799-Karenia_brevis.AAC.1